jgi:hypothetical protein
MKMADLLPSVTDVTACEARAETKPATAHTFGLPPKQGSTIRATSMTPAASASSRIVATRTIVYKGMLLADLQVGNYYLDLRDERFQSRLRLWPWSTSASRPTPSRPGTWRTPTA